MDVESVGASLDAGELDARFGLGLFLGVQELAAQGLVVQFAVGVGEGVEDDGAQFFGEIAVGLLEAVAEGGIGFGVGVVGQQAVDLQQEFFADGDEVGLGDVVQPAERFDEAGQDAAAVEVGEFEQDVAAYAPAPATEDAPPGAA